ncbi:hypothetical protein [Olivibacter sp. XZL3]|uniref:hypothetical protein n=1 Tax=Olivibacter sp. XZL3 TaxID=1735116 RepID=UPI0014170043|nr:hypothetical protein [Olivibacter sp. XZL3]
MKKNGRLTIDEVLSEIELMDYQRTSKIAGGNGGDNSVPMPEPPVDGGWLDEVVIDATWPGGGSDGGTVGGGGPVGGGGGGTGGSGGGSGSGSGGAGNHVDWSIAREVLSKAGYWSWVNGEFVWTVDQGELEEVVITVRAEYTAQDALGLMLSSLGLAADHAAVAAAIAKVEATRGFNLASRAFGILGVGQNVLEMFEAGEWNWQDTGQAALGGVLLIPGLNGVITLGGGAVLFGWELYELMQGEQYV